MLAVRKGSCQKRLLRGRQAHGFQMVQQKTLFFLPTEQLFGGNRGNIRKLPEGMGIDRVRVDVVASGKALQLTVDPARGDLFSLLI